MKRISLLLALSALMPSLCQGYCNTSRYQVHYSPYAFSYHDTGLIPGGIHYSPYALQPNTSGLVYEGTRYTPYAYSYDNSGLVLDYFWWQTPICPVQVITVPCSPCGQRSDDRAPKAIRSSTGYGKATDAMYVIRDYLASRGFKSIDINYCRSVNSRTASVSFILRDRGIAIRYTDPQMTEDQDTTTSSARVAQKAAIKRNSQLWETFATSFRAGGGSVYAINASGNDQIIAALDACRALHPQDDTASEQVLYAKN
jgi:hypothetical protein